MRWWQKVGVLAVLVLALAGPLQAAETLRLAAGAGYKRLVDEACTLFTRRTGIEVERVYGNMGQIVPQVREGGNFDFILGDKSHLESTDVPFSGELALGQGRLVAVVARGVAVSGLQDLTESKVDRIAIADAKKAIYGHAAAEYLTKTGVWDRIQPKLLVVGTVPQVSAYVISGEVDVGFINLTDALAITDKVGLVLPVDEHLYSPILIVAKQLPGPPHPRAAEAFAAFLKEDEVRALLKKNGL